MKQVYHSQSPSELAPREANAGLIDLPSESINLPGRMSRRYATAELCVPDVRHTPELLVFDDDLELDLPGDDEPAIEPVQGKASATPSGSRSPRPSTTERPAKSGDVFEGEGDGEEGHWKIEGRGGGEAGHDGGCLRDGERTIMAPEKNVTYNRGEKGGMEDTSYEADDTIGLDIATKGAKNRNKRIRSVSGCDKDQEARRKKSVMS